MHRKSLSLLIAFSLFLAPFLQLSGLCVAMQHSAEMSVTSVDIPQACGNNVFCATDHTMPELASEVTLLPVDDLGVDAAILFSDISRNTSAALDIERP